MKRVQQGFTLIELMIVVAIIGILAAVAIPQYRDYTAKSKAASAVASLDAYKKAVAICAQERGTFVGCNTAAEGIPTWNATPLVSAVAVDATSAAITADIPVNAMGNAAAGTIVMTPASPAGSPRITWATTGSASLGTVVQAALAKNNPAAPAP